MAKKETEIKVDHNGISAAYNDLVFFSKRLKGITDLAEKFNEIKVLLAQKDALEAAVTEATVALEDAKATRKKLLDDAEDKLLTADAAIAEANSDAAKIKAEAEEDKKQITSNALAEASSIVVEAYENRKKVLEDTAKKAERLQALDIELGKMETRYTELTELMNDISKRVQNVSQ